jgi:hypothetical protein
MQWQRAHQWPVHLLLFMYSYVQFCGFLTFPPSYGPSSLKRQGSRIPHLTFLQSFPHLLFFLLLSWNTIDIYQFFEDMYVFHLSHLLSLFTYLSSKFIFVPNALWLACIWSLCNARQYCALFNTPHAPPFSHDHFILAHLSIAPSSLSNISLQFYTTQHL